MHGGIDFCNGEEGIEFFDGRSEGDHIPIGSVFTTAGSSTLHNVPAFNTEMPPYSQVTELIATVMQKVDRNPFLLQKVYSLFATHVAGPILVMVNELDMRGATVGIGGIQEFSKVNDKLAPANKRFKPGYENRMPRARDGKTRKPSTLLPKQIEQISDSDEDVVLDTLLPPPTFESVAAKGKVPIMTKPLKHAPPFQEVEDAPGSRVNSFVKGKVPMMMNVPTISAKHEV